MVIWYHDQANTVLLLLFLYILNMVHRWCNVKQCHQIIWYYTVVPVKYIPVRDCLEMIIYSIIHYDFFICGASNCSKLFSWLQCLIVVSWKLKAIRVSPVLFLIHIHAHLFSCSHSLSSSFTHSLASSCSPALLCSHEMIFSVYISVCQPLHTSLLLNKCCSANLLEESHIFIFHSLLWRSLYLHPRPFHFSLSYTVCSWGRPPTDKY